MWSNYVYVSALDMEIHCNFQTSIINVEKPSNINLYKAEKTINFKHLQKWIREGLKKMEFSTKGGLGSADFPLRET